MDTIKGLSAYVKTPRFLEGLGIPEDSDITYQFLAQGEYNRNYSFTHPVTGQALVLRINFGSQMHLDKQITYEYEALKLLTSSGRTPKPLYVDDSREYLDQGIMVMEFLEGKPLNYHTDMKKAAKCLSDIHSVPISPDTHLLKAGNPLLAIIEECEEMFSVYENSPLADSDKARRIRNLLNKGRRRIHELDGESPYLCCINTELNNTNFLVDDLHSHTSLIDWEKPLYGEPAQDLGHFLAPTTTFWKTDVILSKDQITSFVDDYIEAVGGRFQTDGLKKRVEVFIPITCLRGMTWCSMAWIEYQQPDRLLRNESTFKKLGQYLDDDFITYIESLF